MFEKLLIFLRLKKRKPLTEEQRQFVAQTTGDALKELEKALCSFESKCLNGYLDAGIDALNKQLKKDGLITDSSTDPTKNT